MSKLVFLGVLLFLFLLSGCASIVSGSKQKISFVSNPSGAKIFLNDVDLGDTPITVNLDRNKKDQKVEIILEGYKPFRMTLTRRINAWVWGNLLFGVIIGLVVDVSTGAIYKLTPSQIEAQMSKGFVLSTNNIDTYIGVVLTSNENWEQIGTLESN